MPRHHLVTAATLLLAATTSAGAQHVVGARDSLALRADSVFQRFNRTDSPGCALGVYENGSIRYARGYGMASLEHGVPLSSRSVLDIGSISKQITAMAVLLLEKDGKLSLDDPIRKHIPELPAYADRITLRRALSQTSGLRDLYTLMGQTGRTFQGDTVDALRIITRSADTNYEPGARYLYTNSGWILAAQAIYRITGKSLAQFAAERIFAPLGMHDTRFLDDATVIIPDHATGYAPRAGGGFRVARSWFDGSILGAGAVQTTIEDFGRWLNNYESGKVGGADVIRKLTTATTLNDRSPARMNAHQAYALGLGVGTMRGLPVITHGGSWAGYRAHFLRFPEERFAVATFCNLTTSGPDSLARKVAGIYLGGKMEPDSAALWVASLQSTPRGELTGAGLRPFAGVWRNVERGEVRRTRVAGDTLFTVAGGERTAAVPLGGARFRTASGAEIRFEGEAGGASRMMVRTAAEQVTFTRADSVVLTAAQLAAYAGRYSSDEVEATHVWHVEKDQLVLYINDRRMGVLEPSYRDGFTRGGTVIDVQRDGRGRVSGFVMEAGRVRGLRFTRVR